MEAPRGHTGSLPPEWTALGGRRKGMGQIHRLTLNVFLASESEDDPPPLKL